MYLHGGLHMEVYTSIHTYAEVYMYLHVRGGRHVLTQRSTYGGLFVLTLRSTHTYAEVNGVAGLLCSGDEGRV